MHAARAFKYTNRAVSALSRQSTSRLSSMLKQFMTTQRDSSPAKSLEWMYTHRACIDIKSFPWKMHSKEFGTWYSETSRKVALKETKKRGFGVFARGILEPGFKLAYTGIHSSDPNTMPSIDPKNPDYMQSFNFLGEQRFIDGARYDSLHNRLPLTASLLNDLNLDQKGLRSLQEYDDSKSPEENSHPLFSFVMSYEGNSLKGKDMKLTVHNGVVYHVLPRRANTGEELSHRYGINYWFCRTTANASSQSLKALSLQLCKRYHELSHRLTEALRHRVQVGVYLIVKDHLRLQSPSDLNNYT